MILFLDFDGVLHPYPLHVDDQHAELLMHTPLLWSLLRRLPELQVVVSSSWRERFNMDYLVDFLTYGGGEELADRNLHGRVVDIAGRRVAGLGGVFRGQVWLPPETPLFASSNDFLMRCGKGNHWRGGLPRKHRSSIFPDHYDQLVAEACDIIVSHEAPFGHRYGFSALNELAGAMGARLIVHGHHHENLDYPETDGLRAMGVGYRCIRDDKGNLVFDGSHFIASERA